MDRILARYGWKLLDPEDFVRRVVGCILSGEVGEPGKAAIHTYCHSLFRACRGDDGIDRQEIGFIELHNYLHKLSFRESADLDPDIRREVLSETLLRIWQNLPNYRRPGAFLAIAALEMRNAVRPLWSRPAPALSLDEDLEQFDSSADSNPLTYALTTELQQQMRICFAEALRHNPKAKQQLEAVWLKYIGGLDDATISGYLGKPIASIHVLRSRGLDKLRAQPCWQLLAQDFEQ